MEEPTFWEDADKASKTMQELKGLKSVVGSCNELSSKYEDIQTLIEMAGEENDESLLPEIKEEMCIRDRLRLPPLRKLLHPMRMWLFPRCRIM